jgi:hypothetical protein
MFELDYIKRKNNELLKSFNDKMQLSNVQNYNPIFETFFKLNETNYNSINLHNKCYLTNIIDNTTNSNIFNCLIEESNNDNKIITKNKKVFFKFAPLLDPLKFLIGKYNINDFNSITLPKFSGEKKTDIEQNKIQLKINNKNNSSYVDGFFSYITSKLYDKYNFIHSVKFYGSFIGIKEEFNYNIADDLSYLGECDFFKKNKDVHFKIDNYDELNKHKQIPIKIDDTNDNILNINDIPSINDIENIFEDIFSSEDDSSSKLLTSINEESFTNLIENDDDNFINKNDESECSSNSSICSSRTSHTSNSDNIYEQTDDKDYEEKNEKINEEKCSDDNIDIDNNDNNDDDDDKESDNWEDEEDEEDEEDDEEDEEVINAIIKNMPVNIICLETCDSTFDELIINNNFSEDEWLSALLQIIMILITYQKLYSFVHNDLHTNNIMYNKTDIKFIIYKYNNEYYKIPTFGRIYKIIDYGRGIYKFNGQLFFSDSFALGEDASTQYNTEPYLNNNKARIESNYSFDLCRLACSIFDYIIDDIKNINKLSKKNNIVKIINEWCLDDNGINILYKTDGKERYPEFKLYKMIAKSVHNHTPNNQLKRPEFKKFVVSNLKNKIKNNPNNHFIDIDLMK